MALNKLNPWGRKTNQPLGASENIQNALGNGLLRELDLGAKIVRGPIFTRIVKVVALAAIVSQAPVNLLATTLSSQPPAQAPFSQEDWQNPVVRKTGVSNRTWLQNLLQSTLAPVQAPFNQDDWQNPVLRKPEVRGATSGVNLNLLSKDKFFGEAGQAPTYD